MYNRFVLLDLVFVTNFKHFKHLKVDTSIGNTHRNPKIFYYFYLQSDAYRVPKLFILKH